jgi:ATP-dependent Clp protease ATP-binding subunit ClpA
LGKGGASEDKAKSIIRSTYKEIKMYDAMLNQYFTKNAKTKDPKLTKLSNQYKELQEAKKQIDKDPKIAQLGTMQDPYEKKRKIAGVVQNIEVQDEQDDDRELMQQLQQKPKIDAVTQSTINVEYAIAKETYELTSELESDFKELHSMMSDMKDMVVEQGDMLDMIEQNVDRSGAYVEQGIDDVKKARNMTGFRMFGLK